MDVRKALLGLTLALLFCNGVAVAADFDKGLQAYNSDDFKTVKILGKHLTKKNRK